MMRTKIYGITRGLYLAAVMLAAGCAVAPRVPSVFTATHGAVLEGVVTSRGGQPLDSVQVLAWRLEEGQGTLLQTRAMTDVSGSFVLPLLVTAGDGPAIQGRVVVRGFTYASRDRRTPAEDAGSVMDTVIVPVLLTPRGEGAPSVARTRITLPVP